MPGRINPREYDLGELRDAVRETSQPDEARSNDGADPQTEVPGHERGDPAASGSGANVSAAEDPEAYLRSRHRRRRPAEGEKREAEQNGQRGTVPPHARNDGRDAGPEPGRNGEYSTDFELLSHGSGGDVSKPYLDELPGTYSAQLEIFEWLDQLVSKAGQEGAIAALDYYESIEWLSTESRDDLEEFVNGLESATSADASLGISDHRESLVYVARLTGRLRP
jgi:archaellum component FlaD/FlaE